MKYESKILEKFADNLEGPDMNKLQIESISYPSDYSRPANSNVMTFERKDGSIYVVQCSLLRRKIK